MNCRETKARMEGFREGTLDKGEADAVADHLGDCPACRHRLAQLDRVDTHLGAAIARGIPPDGFCSRLMARAREESIDRTNPAVSLRWIGQTAALAAGLLLVVGLWMAHEHRMASVPAAAAAQLAVPREARPFYEPAPGSAVKIGAPFVITANGPAPYKGKTSVRIAKAAGPTPRLIVEAFPD